MQWFEKDYFSDAEAPNKLIQSGAVSHSFHGVPWMTYKAEGQCQEISLLC